IFEHVGYDFSDALFWDDKFRQQIHGEDNTHGKTVFCVQLQALTNFINMFLGQQR
ncbi:MAG: hypothetical protein K940chlam7_01872, partial [Chlamydiae bacterium]|nr:hypothetical protein [Chlamydiota bacterium]